jgi:hypothetical protein
MAELKSQDNSFSEESDVEVNHKMDDEMNGAEYWQCITCPKTFSNEQSLKAHYSNFHEKKIHECSICKKTYTRNSSLYTHIKGVHEGVKHTCPICGYKTTQKGNLRGHMTRKHKEIILETGKEAKRGKLLGRRKLFTEEDEVKLIAKYKSLLKENRRQTKDEVQEMAMNLNKKPKQINAFLDNLRYRKYKRANLPALDNDEDLTERSLEPEKVKKKLRCKACVACLVGDCKQCIYCKDKAKYGGPNRLRKTCEKRRCLNLEKKNSTEEQVEKPKKRRFSAKRRSELLEKTDHWAEPKKRKQESINNVSFSAKRKSELLEKIDNGNSNASNSDIQPKINIRKDKISGRNLVMNQTEINQSPEFPRKSLDGPQPKKRKQESINNVPFSAKRKPELLEKRDNGNSYASNSDIQPKINIGKDKYPKLLPNNIGNLAMNQTEINESPKFPRKSLDGPQPKKRKQESINNVPLSEVEEVKIEPSTNLCLSDIQVLEPEKNPVQIDDNEMGVEEVKIEPGSNLCLSGIQEVLGPEKNPVQIDDNEMGLENLNQMPQRLGQITNVMSIQDDEFKAENSEPGIINSKGKIIKFLCNC